MNSSIFKVNIKFDIFKKSICFFLAFFILLFSTDLSVFNPNAEEDTYSNYIDGFTVEAFWKNSDDPLNYIWNATESEQRAPRLVLMYSNPDISNVINKEDIQFIVPCFGDVLRGDTAAKPVYSVDTDWTGTYDSNSNQYTYAYNGEGQTQGSLSGGFELVWNLASRECENDFYKSESVIVKIRQRDKDGNIIIDTNNNEVWKTIKLPPLSFSFTSVRDNYVVNVFDDQVGFISVKDYYENDPDYIWYEINNTIERTDINSRGLEMSTYYIKIAPSNLPEGTDLSQVYIKCGNDYCPLSSLGPYEDGTYRFYPPDFTCMTGDFNKKEITVNLGIPKDSDFSDVSFEITGHFDRLYKDDTEWVYDVIDEKTADIDRVEDSASLYVHSSTPDDYDDEVVPPEYEQGSTGAIIPGHSKSNPYSVNKLNSLDLINGKIISFTLTGSVTSSIQNSYSLIMSDDRLEIKNNDGMYRELTSDEYEFVSITMPALVKHNDIDSSSGGTFYNYTITDENGNVYNGNTSQEQTFSLSDKCSSLKVKIDNIQGSVTYKPIVKVKFQLEEDTFAQDGEIVNHSCMDLSVNTDSTPIMIDRVYAESPVKLREPQVSITSSTSFPVFSFNDKTHSFDTIITSGGSITSDTETRLTKFSLYSVIPSVLNPDIYNENIEINGSYIRASDGARLDDFTGRVEFSTRMYDSSNTLLVADFYFEDEPIMVSSGNSSNFSVSYPVSLPYSAYVESDNMKYIAYSYTMLHDSVSNLTANSAEPPGVDLDGDGKTGEKAARSNASRNLEKAADSWQEYAPKYVKSAYSDSYVKDTHVKIKEDSETDTSRKLTLYSYRLDLQMGNDNAKQLIFYDNLEQYNDTSAEGEGISAWQGTFQGIDVTSSGSNFDSLNLKAEVYYSTAGNAVHDIEDTDVWQHYVEGVTDKAEVKSIAVKITPKTEGDLIYYSTYLYCTIMMQAPSDTDALNKTAINDFTVEYKAVDKSTGNESDTHKEVKSDTARVMLTSQTVKLTLKKTDYGNLLKTYYQTEMVQDTDEDGNPVYDENGEPVMVERTKLDANGDPIILYKHYSPIAGASFELKDDVTGKTYTGTVNARGVLVIDDLQYGTYTVTEMETPQGYETFKPFKISIGAGVASLSGAGSVIDEAGGIRLVNESEDVREYELEIPNERIPGVVQLEKYCNNQLQGKMYIPGAKYELYTSSGKLVHTDENNIYKEDGTKSVFTTDADGHILITDLPWGSYYFMEKEAPTGYKLSTALINFTIRYDNVGLDEDGNQIIISAEAMDLEEPTQILLIKKDKESQSRLKGAQFSLEMLKNGDWISDGNTYTTSTGGQLLLDGLQCFGTYRFKEIQAPDGYELPEGNAAYFPSAEGFTLDPKHISVTVTAENTRNKASVKLRKNSEKDGYLTGAEYTLYKINGKQDLVDTTSLIPTMKPEDGDEADEIVAVRVKTSGELGETDKISDLEWGDYYFLEVVAPKGYQLDTTPIRFTLSAKDADITRVIEVTDQRALGTVKLKKVSQADKSTVLSGAKFNLYLNDGTLVKEDLITDENGIIQVTDLEWGSYYFEETEAPANYGLNPDKIRFSVTQNNCQSIQQLVCEDPPVTAQLKIEKEIDARLDAYGNPTFIFKVEKLSDDETSVTRSWTRMITLTSGLGSSTILSGLEAGTYRVTELPVARYSLIKAEAITPAIDKDSDGNTVTVVLTGNDNAAVKFTNELQRYDKYSHCSSAVNVVSTGKKLTSISAELKNTLMSPTSSKAYNFTDADFTVSAVYDDGSEETLHLGVKPAEGEDPDYSSCRYQLDTWSVAGSEIVQYVPITVIYEENGITATASVVLEIEPISAPKPFTVTFNPTGGYFEVPNNPKSYSLKTMRTFGISENTSNHVTSWQVTFTYDEDTQKMVPDGDVDLMPEINATPPKSFSGWYYDEECSDDKYVDFSVFYDPDRGTKDTTVYAKWIEGNAQLDTGQNLNAKWAELAGSRANVKAIVRSQIPPADTQKETVISASNSQIPVYAWYESDTQTIKWWSQDPTPVMNSSSQSIFNNGMTALADISGIKTWDSSNVKDMEAMFKNCSSLYDFSALQGWDTSNVTNMIDLFYSSNINDTSLTYLGNWKTLNVTDMTQMFWGCTGITDITPIGSWDTQKVTSMFNMFSYCSNLSNINSICWNISNVKSMNQMFFGNAITEINGTTFTDNGNTNKTTSKMFSGCENLKKITKFDFDTQNVTDMSYMFELNYNGGKKYITSIAGLQNQGDKIWNVSKVTNMSNMFARFWTLTSLDPIKGWDVSSVTNFDNFALFIGYNNTGKAAAEKFNSEGGFTLRPGEITNLNSNGGGTYVPY